MGKIIIIDEDFLNMSLAMIRHSVLGIESSYSCFWDILAEFIQNAVDTVNKTNRKVE